MSVDPVRDAAIDVLLRVFDRNAFLSDSLDKTLRRKDLSERGRRFLTQLVYGTVRYKLLADHVLTGLLDQPLAKLPTPILAILRMGVFQSLFCSQVTFPAMVHTSVDLAKKRGHIGTARLTNAVLKRVPQRIEDVRLPERGSVDALAIRHSMPRWLVAQWAAEFGLEQAEALCASSNEQAPTTVRANTEKIDTDVLARDLERAGCMVSKSSPVPEELTVAGGAPLRSKHFQNGHFTLQDPASMLAAHLVEPRAGQRILDVCAAPGGKSTHLAQLARGQAFVVAMDTRPNRLGLVVDNVERLNARGVHVVCGNGREPPVRGPFDAVLLDAPCSGLGTLRRHPDLKWRARPDDAARLAETQRELLRCAIDLCKNGGRIVYSVCTFTRDETFGVAEFAQSLENLEPESGPEWLEPWKIGPGMYRTLPVNGKWDGFFLMALRKSY